MVTPTIEKLLVDIQKDEDFDYMQGTEITYMYQTAFDLYTVNTPKMLRYAKRRGAYDSTYSLIEQSQNMINKECFTARWIEEKSKELNYPDKISLKRSSMPFHCWTCWRLQVAHFISKVEAV